MRSSFWNAVRTHPQIVLFVLIILGVSFRFWYVIQSPELPRVQAPGSPIDLRGSQIMKLRINKPDILQEITIHHDAMASRTDNPPYQNRWMRKQLTDGEYQVLMLLRYQWCTEHPTFQTTEQDVHDYDFGVQCTDSNTVTQFRIPVNELPEALAVVARKLPPLSPLP
jgi:hypothetical protein